MSRKNKMTPDAEAISTDALVKQFGSTVRNAAGFDGVPGDTIATMAALFAVLLSQNWKNIQEIQGSSEDAQMSVAIGFDIDAAGKVPIVKAKISYAQKFKDSLSAQVADPAQLTLIGNN